MTVSYKLPYFCLLDPFSDDPFVSEQAEEFENEWDGIFSLNNAY